jgi:hypothetical protein
MIKEFKREKHTVWGSFRHEVWKHCHGNFGTDIPLFFSMRRGLQSFALSWIGLAHWMDYYESALILPNLSICLSRRWFKALNDQGISVIVWGFGRDDGGPGGGVNTIDGYERVRCV